MWLVRAAAVAVLANLLAVTLIGCGYNNSPPEKQEEFPTWGETTATAQPTQEHLFACPPGYSQAHDSGGKFPEDDAVKACGVKCDEMVTCRAFRYSVSKGLCDILDYDAFEDSRSDSGIQMCNKMELRRFDKKEAPLYKPDEFVEQTDAYFNVGGEIGVYAVGSSNLVWMTWLEQLHLNLRRLGYKLPLVPARRTPEKFPRRIPWCDDSQYFQHLRTSRFSRIGWASWDFALEGWEGCGADGFRIVEGLRVKCQHGPGCVFSKNPLLISDIASDASHSNITFVSTWFNDDQQWSTHFKCFGGKKVDRREIEPVSVKLVRRMVQKIHARNPNTWVVIMSKYPETYQHKTPEYILEYNRRVKVAVEQEPKTLFVDYYIPNDLEGEFYQALVHGGHPNCRGSQIMANAVLSRLFEAKVLPRSLLLAEGTKGNLLAQKCGQLAVDACHTSGFCWRDPTDGFCKVYKPGNFQPHPNY
mmetsp:Transcript_68063/g.134254  ORF Transcript_68063/g.134254 Transcript_68063/m.134254 type:complete len:472 (+) Transcript_68063:58-1473(+)